LTLVYIDCHMRFWEEWEKGTYRIYFWCLY